MYWILNIRFYHILMHDLLNKKKIYHKFLIPVLNSNNNNSILFEKYSTLLIKYILFVTHCLNVSWTFTVSGVLAVIVNYSPD